MIINSPFTDYYDKAANKIRDPKIVWNRTQHVVQPRSTDWNEDFRRICDLFSCSGYWDENGVGAVLVGGTVFPFGAECLSVFGNIGEFTELDYSNPYKKIKTSRYTFFRPRYAFHKQPNYDGTGFEHEYAKNFCRKYSPVVLVSHCVVLDVSLRFLRPPISTIEIVNKIMAIMQPDEPAIPQTDDVTMAEAKGYDKNSFRREKGGPTRKRKKINK